MRIVIASPLYPPDIGDPAPYVKELVTRLAKNHEVVVVTYGRYPEAVPGVTILATNKRLPAPFRLFGFTLNLILALSGADRLYIQSGVSAELPALLATLLRPVSLFFRKSDEPLRSGALRAFVRRAVLKRSVEIHTPGTLARPEILPLAPYPSEAFATFEKSWGAHVSQLLA